MLPVTAGARPGNRNMMSLPNSANSRLLPERKPSPTPTSSSKDPTPPGDPEHGENRAQLVRPEVAKDLREDVKRGAHHRETLYICDIGRKLSNQALHHPR